MLVMLHIRYRKSWFRATAMGVVALCVVAGGAYAHEARLSKSIPAPSQTTAQTAQDSSLTPSRDKTPDAKHRHTVPPTHPRQLKIPQLGIDANILPVGLTAEGAMDAPTTAWDAGWYSQSALPGIGSGAVLIDGHVNNAIGTPGIFFRIDSLKPGDTIQIERGDRIVLTYSVVIVEQKKIEDVDMNKMMHSVTPGKQGLNLITCGGTYSSQRKTFDERILVYAHQVK